MRRTASTLRYHSTSSSSASALLRGSDLAPILKSNPLMSGSAGKILKTTRTTSFTAVGVSTTRREMSGFIVGGWRTMPATKTSKKGAVSVASRTGGPGSPSQTRLWFPTTTATKECAELNTASPSSTTTTTDQKQETKKDYIMPHPIWKGQYTDGVEITHKPAKGIIAKMAYYTIKAIRFNFDWMSGYNFGSLTERKMITRIVFLETVAGVPGSLAGMMRHFASLRNMQRDHGWIHTLLEEAENERMHLLFALQMRPPGVFMRTMVWMTQGIFANFYFIAYTMSPKYCHKVVGYLEEEAVKTYTRCLFEIDHGSLQRWKTAPAPPLAIEYWKMPQNATIRDVILVMRADEAHHRDVNHTFGDMKWDDPNPFPPGY